MEKYIDNKALVLNHNSIPNIKIKDKVIKKWTNKLDITDFYLFPHTNKYRLVKIAEYKPPRGYIKNALATIEYFNIVKNSKEIIKVDFQFTKSENESLLSVISKDNFKLDKKVLNSFNLKDFSKKNIKTLNENIKIKKAKIDSWNFIEKTIIIKVDLVVFNTKTNVLLKYDTNVNLYDFILNFVQFDCKENHFVLQDDEELSFEPVKIHSQLKPLIKNFFSNKDIEKIKNILKKLEIISTKIKTLDIDILNKKAKAQFECSVKIDDVNIDNIFINATYDATILEKKMIKMINELPLENKIKGIPRRNLKLSDVFEKWNQLYIWKSFSKRGIGKFLNKYINIKVENLDFLNKSAKMHLQFVKANTSKIILTKQIYFENNIWNEIVLENKDKIINIKFQKILLGSARNDLQSKHFTIANNQFKVYEAKCLEKNNLSKQSYNYQFKIIFRKKFIFSYNQKITFGFSQQEIFFENLKDKNYNFSYFQRKNIDYFQQKINQLDFKVEWIFLTKVEIKRIKISKKFQDCNFKIINCCFQKINFSKTNQLLIKFNVKTQNSDKVRAFQKIIKINNFKILNDFKNLNTNNINFVDKNVLKSFPIPFLDVQDFYAPKPFMIDYVSIKYNEKHFFINCLFQVSYLDKTKLIEKRYYFGNAHQKTEELDVEVVNIKNVENKQIKVSYDKKTKNYYKYQNITFETNLKNIFIEIENWKLKNRRGKVLLNLLIRYKNDVKQINKYIKYDHFLTRKLYKEWKVANYGK